LQTNIDAKAGIFEQSGCQDTAMPQTQSSIAKTVAHQLIPIDIKARKIRNPAREEVRRVLKTD
jgi:hypothetical protein